MPPGLTFLLRGPASAKAGIRGIIGGILLGALHVLALLAMWFTEHDATAKLFFVLFWIVLNAAFLTVFRRPAISAALGLLVIAGIVVLSEFKISIVSMSMNFFDMLIVDPDTIAFLLATFPDLRLTVAACVSVGVPLIALTWWADPFRIKRWKSAVLVLGAFGSFIGLSVALPDDPEEVWLGTNHVSIFTRSGVSTTASLIRKGWIDFDRTTNERLRLADDDTCAPARKPPHIIMVLDEGSFDATALPGVNVPAGYAGYFRSSDGKARKLLVEAVGGPTWYTEYNVLTGLSALSFGNLSFNVTRIAAGNVLRGLPHVLRRCGYKTVSLYPAYGAFLSARTFQTGTGVERFLDYGDMKQVGSEPDYFFYDQALRQLKLAKNDQPHFIFVYTVVNHFPWSHRFRPELTPDWESLNTDFEIDEYVRRQKLSATDFSKFMERLREDFPGESFLVVRFGDHQPSIARPLFDGTIGRPRAPPPLDDLRQYTTYYAFDTINFQPANLSSALDLLDAPYLPLAVLEAAGLPLDATFVEQKHILNRCRGVFYRCAGGAEARRFNRLLIDAGLIRGLASR